jgi:hypothetical protein
MHDRRRHERRPVSRQGSHACIHTPFRRHPSSCGSTRCALASRNAGRAGLLSPRREAAHPLRRSGLCALARPRSAGRRRSVRVSHACARSRRADAGACSVIANLFEQRTFSARHLVCSRIKRNQPKSGSPKHVACAYMHRAHCISAIAQTLKAMQDRATPRQFRLAG